MRVCDGDKLAVAGAKLERKGQHTPVIGREVRVLPPALKEDTMGKYRKKPVVIEAFQMTREHRLSNADWPEWLHRAWQGERGAVGSLFPTEEGTGDGTLSIGTLVGQHIVSWDDWIIQGVQGELYPCKPDIFEQSYERAMR